jgi:hypothetical protein
VVRTRSGSGGDSTSNGQDTYNEETPSTHLQPP